MNALEAVIIPKCENTVKCKAPVLIGCPPDAKTNPRLTYAACADILSELDEMEREEFFRLKKIQDKKAQRLALEKAKNLAIEEAYLAKGIVRGGPLSFHLRSPLKRQRVTD